MSEQPLQKAIRQLPTYQPPEFVWEEIKSTLESGAKPLNIRRLYPRIATAAAAILLLMAAFNFWPASEASPQVAYSVEEKTTPAPLFDIDWNADEDLIDEVVSLFEQSPKAVNASNYQTLQEEFNELNDAKEELEIIMQKYGQDAGAVEQLKEIELERTTVIKEMASLI